METNRLRQFCIVYETRNLRKAAEILYLSHSALSKSLKVLQEEIGLRLIEQDGRGIVITDEGKNFFPKAQALLDLEKQILTQTGYSPEIFKVGSFESFSTHLLGMKWQKYFADLPLQIHELSSGHLEKAVAESAIDAAITYDPVPTRDVEFLSLGKVTMGIYHRKGFFKKM
jgi:DNA-binding transcriptional LysR family regulator